MFIYCIFWTSTFDKTLNLMYANKSYVALTLNIMDANINGFTVYNMWLGCYGRSVI